MMKPFAFAACSLAFALAGCVKIPDDVRATFAPPAPAEASNFRMGTRSGGARASAMSSTTPAPEVPAAEPAVVEGARDRGSP
jgi:hypothetical protein